MSDQTKKQLVEVMVVHLTSGTTVRANVVPGSVKVRRGNVSEVLLGIDYESYPGEDELVYIDPGQVDAIVIERWEHPIAETPDDDGDNDG